MSHDETESSAAPTDPAEYRLWRQRPGRMKWMKWRMETAAYVALEAVLGALPIAWVASAGRLAGAAAHRLLPRRRRLVLRNLRIALAGERTREELRGLTAEVFRRSGANLLCSLRTADMGERSLARAVVVRDEIVFREAAARGKGVVMVIAHMGNWEALAQWFPKLLPPGVAGATVYRPLNNPIMNARVVATRARRGVGLFSKDDNPLGMAGFLRRGGVLGVLSDQRAGKIGELVPFFGRITSCTPIPAILARRTGAAVVGVSLRTVGAGRWEMGFHAMSPGEPTTARVMGLLETMMRESVADVFWLQDRWRSPGRSPHRLIGKEPRGEAPPPAKRRRALLWTHADGRVARAPRAVPDDVDYETARREGGESAESVLRRVDEAAELPLDFVVSAEDETALRAACERLEIAWTREAVE
jgi:KDO2-lipid IV(A) lauroyltransferase